MPADPRARIAGLYAIADSAWLTPETYLTATEAALRGGARIVQYRDKHNDAATRARLAAGLVALCRRYQALCLINDDAQLALASGADGVHIGRDDPDLRAARALLGPQAVIGVSCYNQLQLARAAAVDGADYVAFGSFFPSGTKPQAVRADLALLRAARAGLDLPIVAIGGITPDNGAPLVAAGADALAVIEGLWGQADVGAAAARYAVLFGRTAR